MARQWESPDVLPDKIVIFLISTKKEKSDLFDIRAEGYEEMLPLRTKYTCLRKSGKKTSSQAVQKLTRVARFGFRLEDFEF